MGKFYRVNREFKDLLKDLKFTFHNREETASTGVSYYTQHQTGKQIKIDSKHNFIVLLDNKGEVVDESYTFTEKEINNFLEV